MTTSLITSLQGRDSVPVNHSGVTILGELLCNANSLKLVLAITSL